MLRLEDALAAVQTHPQLRVAEAAALGQARSRAECLELLRRERQGFDADLGQPLDDEGVG